MAEGTLLPPSVLFVDTDIDAEAKRIPERKLWKFEGRQSSSSASICPLYNALVDNKYRIRDQVLTLDQPHAYFWNAVDIEMPEGRNQVLLQTFRPQHDLGAGLGREAAEKIVRNQLETCAKHKAQFDKFSNRNDDGWEFLASTLQSTNARDFRGRRILLVAPRKASTSGIVTYDKNNEISSRIHYIARDLCTERILRTDAHGSTGGEGSSRAHKFSAPVARYFINQLMKATKLCHKCKIFGVVPAPEELPTSSRAASSGSIASEILLFRQQGCYHLKLMLGDTAEIIEDGEDNLAKLERLKAQDLDRIADLYFNILDPDQHSDSGAPLSREDCAMFAAHRYEHGTPHPREQQTIGGGGPGAAAPEQFMKPQAILEMEEALQHQLPAPVLLPAKKDISAVRDHIKDLVRDEFRSFQTQLQEQAQAPAASATAHTLPTDEQAAAATPSSPGDGTIPRRLQEAIRLCQLPTLPQSTDTRDMVDHCLCAIRENSNSTVEMIVLVAPREPMESSNPREHNPNRWPDMVVRFRLTPDLSEEAPVSAGGAAATSQHTDADEAAAGLAHQVSTQTQIEAWYMSGQTIDAWNSFKYALNSKLLKKSSEEIKRDMLVNTDKLLTALQKAIETPQSMTMDDINGLTAHIACMMAYTQAVQKGDGDEKDAIRQAVGDFHERFETAWRYVCGVHAGGGTVRDARDARDVLWCPRSFQGEVHPWWRTDSLCTRIHAPPAPPGLLLDTHVCCEQ